MKRKKNKHIKLYKAIGANIKIKRKELNLSQEELAFTVSSTRNYIGCVERGEKAASTAFLYDVANALGCKIEDFFVF